MRLFSDMSKSLAARQKMTIFLPLEFQDGLQAVLRLVNPLLKIDVLVGSRFSEGFPKAIANPIINYGYFQPDQVFWRPFANKKS